MIRKTILFIILLLFLRTMSICAAEVKVTWDDPDWNSNANPRPQIHHEVTISGDLNDIACEAMALAEKHDGKTELPSGVYLPCSKPTPSSTFNYPGMFVTPNNVVTQ